ncbi:MAG: ankyrin repeat domain-containing protein [Psychromonas sp.]
MKNWKTYKKTYRTEPDIFDFSRTGDLRGLANLLTNPLQLDLDAKNHRGYSPLMLAVYNGNKDFCDALLRCGADVNSTDLVGNSLLMGATFKGDLSIVKLLLQFDANVTLENKTKMTVRDWALMFKRTEILTYLDSHYTSEHSSSKIKNILRFMKLGIILLHTKIRKN